MLNVIVLTVMFYIFRRFFPKTCFKSNIYSSKPVKIHSLVRLCTYVNVEKNRPLTQKSTPKRPKVKVLFFIYIHTYVLYNTSYNLTRRFKKGPPRCHAPRHARLARIPVRKHRDALSPARARNPRFIAKRPMLGKTG
jgi:uncharacterized membrane protein